MYYDARRPKNYEVSADLLEIRTPGFVLDEMNTVDRIVNQLRNDIVSSKMEGSDFDKAFQAFEAEWKDFFSTHNKGIGGWWSRGTTPVYNKTVEFRNRSLDWANRFKQLGGKTVAVLPPKKNENFMRRWGGWLVLAGIGAAWYFSRK